ncbi:GTP pyrophosphokinase [Konateibacter massiliensis]|uniref:GTP pyrophosphokinase n=1 Tax=Konateibacter massiliensis TaxID=2002841 RepID=UPI000C15D034|nr:GTP pyrophosphokinase family protein [Konateibacter massiliensis]
MEIQLWRELLNPYELAVNELILKFRHLIKEHKENGLYSPIEQVTGRVKTISSILEKMQKKKIPFEDLEEKVEDIAGLRIICQFEEDIYRVVELIENRKDMEIKLVKDYLDNVKESGYRSYHLIIFYDVYTINGTKRLQVEIQIRTLAMDFWATVEHSLQYKYKKNMPEHIKERLSSAADAVRVLDSEMSSVRSEIMDAQNSFQIKANVVADILNNIQNLYKVANKREVSKIQDEFYKIYKTEDVDQLRRFNKQLDIIAEGYRAQAITRDIS